MSAGTGRESMSQRGQEDCDGCEQPIRGVVNTHGGLMLCDRCFRPWAADKARIAGEVTAWMQPVTDNPDGIRDNGCRLGKPPQWWALSDAAGEPLPEVQEAPQAARKPVPVSNVVRLPSAQPAARPVSTVAIRVPTVEPVRVRRAPEVETRLGSVATVPVYGAPVKVPTRLLVWAEKRAPKPETTAERVVALIKREKKWVGASLVKQELGIRQDAAKVILLGLVEEGILIQSVQNHPVWGLPGMEPPPMPTGQQIRAAVASFGGECSIMQVAEKLGWTPYYTAQFAKGLKGIVCKGGRLRVSK